MRALSVLALSMLFVLPGFVQADELTEAYQKEYAYLVAEREAIAQRLATVGAQQQQTLQTLRRDIDRLESQYLGFQNRADQLNEAIADASRAAETGSSDDDLLDTTLLQARESLSGLDKTIAESGTLTEQLEQAFATAQAVIQRDSTVWNRDMEFFTAAGEPVQGTVAQVGRIASYAVGDAASGMLYPSGNGRLSIWEADQNVAGTVWNGTNNPDALAVFFYDNINKAIERRDAAGFEEELAAGGLIGKIIVALGAIGLVLVLVRAALLLRLNQETDSVPGPVAHAIDQRDHQQALNLLEKDSGVNPVIANTIRHLNQPREQLEDVISESLIRERSRVDRFAAAILVFAAVAPLLGLLGTVTGMISTFDIITEFGTGDPKLLSSGISEALITTKFGLVVAIPLLLLGNMLTAWGTRIKNQLEQTALALMNSFKTA